MTENMQLAGRRISVVGAGVSGRALAELAAGLGAEVFVSDVKEPDAAVTKAFAEMGIKWEGGGNTERVLEADEILVSSAYRRKPRYLRRPPLRALR